MKKLTSETKIILLSSFIGILILFTLVYSTIKEQNFLKSGFKKKVEKIESFKSRGIYSVNIDCIYFTDGTCTYFSTYSVIEENDTLTDVRVIDFIDVGDSIIKHEGEALIRGVRTSLKY
ncbi:MAG: hypothetical protein KF704_08380 [Crocinitomicaceae bacterium]|nr:hypothetical protein [Crocinitomicaceae bacterium]